jgi:ABC-type transport system substrate-binding protein
MYRTIRYPDSADPQHKALIDAMRGKTLPQIGRIEVSIIEESQPELLAFMQADLDLMQLAGDDASRVMQDGKLKPELVNKGVQHVRFVAPSVTFTYFNLDDPVVGGYSNARVALRRAIAMGFDIDNFIKVLFAGNALPATQLLPPGVNGHDPGVPAKSIYDPVAARALLDRFGFKDVDGDGYRETPEGKPLTLVRGTLPESWYRDADTLWKKNMDAIGIRMQINQQTFAELLNQMRAGKLQMFNLGYRSLEPSGFQILQTLWSKEQRDVNPSGFKRPDYDAAYEAFLRTPSGPERTALARRMSEISQAWVPMILHTYGVGNVVYYPWLLGYWPSQFGGSWKYADLDIARRKTAAAKAR